MLHEPSGAGLISISFDKGKGGGGIKGIVELIMGVKSGETRGGGGRFINDGLVFITLEDETLKSIFLTSVYKERNDMMWIQNEKTKKIRRLETKLRNYKTKVLQEKKCY